MLTRRMVCSLILGTVTTSRSAGRPARKPATPSPVETTSLTTRRPPPDVWREALRLADGDARRIEVADDGTVTITNHRVR